MPRPKDEFLYDFFLKHSVGKALCKNGQCNKVLHAHAGNLSRHLNKFHPELYKIYMKKKNGAKRDQVRSSLIPASKLKTNLGNLDISNSELAIVELFTKNECPIHMVEERAFKVLLQPIFDALGTTMNEQNIAERITTHFQNIKFNIMDDLNMCEYISLKFDFATKQDLIVLGVNVQYVKNKTIQIKTLAIKKLETNDTNECIIAVILEVLEEYGINLTQIISITTDKGVNMIDTYLEDSQVEFCSEDQLNYCLIENVMESIEKTFSLHNIACVPCAADILQICVRDTINATDIKDKLDNIRTVVTKLKTQIYLNILRSKSYKKPIIDCPAKWNSTYNMLQRLLELKDIINLLSTESVELYLSPEIWIFVKDCTDVFETIYDVTLTSQTQQLCFSEVYIIVMDLIFKIENLTQGEMAKAFLNFLNQQKSKLFEIDLFNAAVFLDPRIKICLDLQQKENGKKYIIRLYERINELKEIKPEDNMSLGSTENLEEPSTSSKANSFSEFLQKLDTSSTEYNHQLSDLQKDFMLYELEARLPIDFNILGYWFNRTGLLSSLAEIILAIPATQASVARLLSALKYILSQQPNSLTEFNIEQILLVKCNGEFNYV